MDGDEIIDLGDEREQVLAEMKQSLGGSKDASGQNVQIYYKKKPLFMRFIGILTSILPL